MRWSEWRDLNSRSHGPKPRALPAGLHPDICRIKNALELMIGLEPTTRRLQGGYSAIEPHQHNLIYITRYISGWINSCGWVLQELNLRRGLCSPLRHRSWLIKRRQPTKRTAAPKVVVRWTYQKSSQFRTHRKQNIFNMGELFFSYNMKETIQNE